MKYIAPDWPAPSTIKAYTTVRSSWGEYGKANDDKQTQELVELLNLPAPPVWIKQIHSNEVVEAIPENTLMRADASFARAKKHICAVMTADCLPILITNQQGTKVAAIHAGWRGLANGIVENTLHKLAEAPQDLMIWLGPAIGPSKFEVGSDVWDAFCRSQTGADQAFQTLHEGKWLADLYRLASLRLQAQGITQIYGGEFCTYSQKDLFFSYRRDKGHSGRMASLIWIE